MRKSPIQKGLRLGILCGTIVVLALMSTGVLGNGEDMQPAPGCSVPMPELPMWAGLFSLLAFGLFGELRRKRNSNLNQSRLPQAAFNLCEQTGAALAS